MNLSFNEPVIFFTESSLNIGGQELQILQQIESLKTKNYSSILFCNPRGKIFALANDRGIQVIPICYKNSYDFYHIFKILKAIKKFNPIAIISHSGHDSGISAFAAILSKYLFGIRPKLIRMKTYLTKPISFFSTIKLFDLIYTPSEFLRNKVIGKNKSLESKVGVLYPGIAFSELDAVEESELPGHLVKWLSNNPGPVISHGAMLRPEKGHELIISAFPKVLAVHKNVRYVIAGEGVERSRLEVLVRQLQLENSVYFAGMVSPIAALLKNSTLAILPSLVEPLGMFQIESQYLCVPTLANKVGGITETMIHRETGLLIDAAGEDVWAQNIIWALENIPLMRNWAQNGRKYVDEHFSLRKNTENLIKIISSHKVYPQ